MTNWDDRVNASAVVERTAFDHDMYGVEVEVEYNSTSDIPQAVREFWSCVRDGSLRSHGNQGDQAAEFRYTKPLNYHLSEVAVKHLCSTLTEMSKKIYSSGRTSTHVHVNVLNIPKIQIMNLITLSIIFDEFLVAQHHPFRSGNLFALRFVDAEWPINWLVQSLIQDINIRSFGNSSWKYASVNLSSIGKYGTIEYRSMDGEINSARINQWVSCLHRLKNLATKYKNPREIIEKFHKYGAFVFMREHIPSYYCTTLPTPTIIDMLTRGVVLASDLAYSSDWISTVASKRQPEILSDYTITNSVMSSPMSAAEFAQDWSIAAQPQPPPPGWGQSPPTPTSPSLQLINNYLNAFPPNLLAGDLQ